MPDGGTPRSEPPTRVNPRLDPTTCGAEPRVSAAAADSVQLPVDEPGPPHDPGPAPDAVWFARDPQALRGASGRALSESVLTGDWKGSFTAAGAAVGAMFAFEAAVTLLLLVAGGSVFVGVLGGNPFLMGLSSALSGVAASAGGSYTLGGEFLGQQVSAGVVAGHSLGAVLAVLVMVRLTSRRLRRSHDQLTSDTVLAAGVRLVVVFAALCALAAILGRLLWAASGADLTGGAGLPSTIFGASLRASIAVGILFVGSYATLGPPWLLRLRQSIFSPVVAAAGVLVVATPLAVLAFLGQVTSETVGLGAGTANVVLFSAAVLLASCVDVGAQLVLVGMGVPVSFAGEQVTLIDLVRSSPAALLIPVAVLGLILLAACALVARQPDLARARREGMRFAGGMAVVAVLMSLESSFQISAGASGAGTLSADFGANPLVAAPVAAAWGLLAGLLAPSVLPLLPARFVRAVRSRTPDPDTILERLQAEVTRRG